MSSVLWPTARGSRGKRKEVEPKHGQSMTAVASSQGVYYECFSHSERYDHKTDTVKELRIDDRSLTRAQHLKLFDRRSGLLIKSSNPFKMAEDVKRMTSRSKRITLDADTTKFEKYDK